MERDLFVAKFSLRKVETQATASAVLSLSSLFFLLGLAVLVFRHFDWQSKSIFYKEGTLRVVALGLCGLFSLGLSVLGFGFGISSAGERRNQRNNLSWGGFFVGAFAICLTLVLLAFFFFWREPVLTG